MNSRKRQPYEDVELIDKATASQLTSLGINTVTRLAKESGTGLKIGRSFRIQREPFLRYISENYKAD